MNAMSSGYISGDPGRDQPSRPRKPPVSDVTAEFGARVRARRRELGLSQERLADRADLHWTFVGQVERGQRNVTLHNIVRLADALGVNAAHVTDGLTFRE
jgi:ribosome-binding protein aMBF1 (putative translation factor)